MMVFGIYVVYAIIYLQDARQANLKMHSDTKHIGAKHECDLCVFKEKTKAIIQNHAQTKHKGLSYNCVKCDFQTSWKAEVKVLIVKIHSGIMNVPDMLSWQGKGMFFKATDDI